MKGGARLYKNLLDNLYDGVYVVDRDRKISYWNRGAERITGFKVAEAVGRQCQENFLNHVDEQGNHLCLAGCPLSATMADGEPRSDQVYLLHKDGHRVPVLVRTAPMRETNDEIVGAVEIFSENTAMGTAMERIKELEKMAYIDPLTEIANRRYATINLLTRYEQMQRYGWRFGVMMIDIDHFKIVNDRFGHDVGDQVLKMVAKTLLVNSRTFDIVGRWGGEEFIAIIVNPDEGQLHSIAERFCSLVERSNISYGSEVIRVTISIGATIARPDDTIDTLLKRADQLMYQSKAVGRNCVSTDLNQ